MSRLIEKFFFAPLAAFPAALNRGAPDFALNAADIDADGRVFRRLAIILLSITVLRMVYVTTSGVPFGNFPIVFFGIGLAALVSSARTAKVGVGRGCLFSRAIALLGLTGSTIPTAAFCVFHTGRRFPLADGALERADRLFGFDWLAYARLLDTHPWWWDVTLTAYNSIYLQFFFAVFVLAFSLSAHRLYTYLLAQTFTITLTTLIVYFLPAIGAYEQAGAAHAGFLHHFLTADTMTSSINWLRGDDMGAPGGVTSGALVSFPSFHAASAVLFTWAWWRVPYLRWVVLALNTAMALGTPIHGSHYLVDVIAGVFIAGVCIALATSLIEVLARQPKPSVVVANPAVC